MSEEESAYYRTDDSFQDVHTLLPAHYAGIYGSVPDVITERSRSNEAEMNKVTGQSQWPLRVQYYVIPAIVLNWFQIAGWEQS